MKLDEKKWQKLIVAFREQPGNFKNAARFAGCDRGTARKAWAVGWPAFNRKAAQAILAEEEETKAALARAKAEAVRTETEAFAMALRGDMRSQALEEYERTNKYLRAASATATATLVAAHRLQPTVQELAVIAPKLVEIIHYEVSNGEVNADKAMVYLEKIASITKSVAAAANSATLQGAKVFEVSRARTNSESILNIDKAVNAEPFDPAEAKRLAAELAEAALEAEAWDPSKPTLNVISGEKQAEMDEADSEESDA